MNQLGIFAKYWQPGAVKTRLAATMGDEPASRLYRSFVHALVDRFRGQADRRMLAYTPAIRHPEFARLAAPDWLVEEQGDGDLGQRMERYFAHGLEHADRCILIGSDSPNLPARFLDEAFAALRSNAVVLGPTEDGGYYLIGLRAKEPSIFREINWSTDQVWSQTVSRLQDADVSFATLPVWYDVDVFDDLQRLYLDLKTSADNSAAMNELCTSVAAAIPEPPHV